jgi:cytosine/adenosine deaminase-related metal-dependent hydrolase
MAKIITADHVVPIGVPPLERGAVVVDGPEIVFVGERLAAAAAFPAADIEDFGEAAILPGFVNCHSHLEITAFRGRLDPVEHDFRSWLLTLNEERAKLSAEEIEAAACAGVREGLEAGVTCFGDVGRFGQAGTRALTKAGVRGVVFQETEFSPGSDTADEHFAVLRERYEQLSAEAGELVEIGLSPHAPYTVSRRLLEMIAEFAAARAVKLAIHAAESRDEDELLRQGTGFFRELYDSFSVEWDCPHLSPIEFLGGCGILAAKPLLIHCVTVTDSDIELIARSGAKVAHCPKSNAKFGHGAAPLAALLAAGIDVGLGSDSVASNNVCDMIEEARFAALGARIHASRPGFISSEEVLRYATVGGADALGLGHLIGTLEPGKQADIAVISLAHTAQKPVHDPCTAIVFSSNARDVVMTMAAGQELYRKPQLP